MYLLLCIFYFSDISPTTTDKAEEDVSMEPSNNDSEEMEVIEAPIITVSTSPA